MDHVSNHVVNLDASVIMMNSNFEKISKRVTSIEESVHDFQVSQNAMKQDYETVSQKSERLEKSVKDKQLLVTCEREFGCDDKNLERVVYQCLENKLGLRKDQLCYIDVERLGRSKKTVVLSLPTLKLKNEMFMLKKRVRNENPNEVDGFFINDFLTSKRDKLFKELRRQQKEEGKFFSVFTFHGDIFIKTAANGNKKLIRSLSDVNS
jgi:hypothetical protein